MRIAKTIEERESWRRRERESEREDWNKNKKVLNGRRRRSGYYGEEAKWSEALLSRMNWPPF